MCSPNAAECGVRPWETPCSQGYQVIFMQILFWNTSSCCQSNGTSTWNEDGLLMSGVMCLGACRIWGDRGRVQLSSVSGWSSEAEMWKDTVEATVFPISTFRVHLVLRKLLAALALTLKEHLVEMQMPQPGQPPQHFYKKTSCSQLCQTCELTWCFSSVP